MNNGHIDLSITLGTSADMRGIDQVRKGVEELNTATSNLPRELISGGVGTVAPSRSFAGDTSASGMTVQVGGLDRLAGTMARVEGALDRSMAGQDRTEAMWEQVQTGIGRAAEAVENVARGTASRQSAVAPSGTGNGQEFMLAKLDAIAALLASMNSTLTKTLAASTKQDGAPPLTDQIQKGLDEFTRVMKTAPLLSSGGVGGDTGAIPAYKEQSVNPQEWNLRIDGLEALGATVQGADKTLGHAVDAVARQSGWMQRSIDAIKGLPGQLQSWTGNQMKDWRKFNGGMQNAVNMLNLVKQAWDLGTAAGDALQDAFGLGAKKVNEQMADMLAKAKSKVEAWQAGMSDELSRMSQESALKKEEQLVQQINDAYESRKRTIEALDEKATRNLETQAKLLAIENETSRSIIRQKQIRGEMTESQARDALASIDAKDAGERRDIERKQAENAVKRADALAEAKAEQIRRMQELSQSSPAAAGVRDLKVDEFYKQADATKNAEAALKEWRKLEAQRAKLQKEVDGAAAEMAKASMLGGVGVPLVAGLMQKKEQDEENLKHVKSLMDGMRKDAKMPEATSGEMMARLIAEKQQQEAALNKMMEGIRNTGLLGDIRGKSGDALYIAYADTLKMAQSVIFQRTDTLEALIKEQEALDESVATARERMQNILSVQRAEEQGEATRKKETDKTNARQDEQKRDATITKTAADTLFKTAEAKKKELEANKRAMDTAAEVMNTSVDSFSGFATKYAERSEKAAERVNKFLNTISRLKNKDKKLWDKRDKDDAKWADTFLASLKKKFGNDYNNESDKAMVTAATQAVNKVKDILTRTKNQKREEEEIRKLEEAARQAAGLTDQITGKNSAAMELDEWINKQRTTLTGRMGDLARTDMSGHMPMVEALVKKVLSDQGDGGKSITRRESGELTRLLKQLEAVSPRDSTPELEEALTLIRTIIGAYAVTTSTQARLMADVKKMRAEVEKIKSQAQYGRRS